MLYQRLSYLLPNYWRTINPAFFILDKIGINLKDLIARRWIYLQLQRQKKLPFELLDQIEIELFNGNAEVTDNEILFLKDNLFVAMELREEIETLEALNEKNHKEYQWSLINENWDTLSFCYFDERNKRFEILREKENLLKELEKKFRRNWKLFSF